jgi:hypothetical protein
MAEKGARGLELYSKLDAVGRIKRKRGIKSKRKIRIKIRECVRPTQNA